MWAGSQYGFYGCIGATDGTTFLLAYQTALHPWTHYDRKGRYSLNAVVTCDWSGRIFSIVQGCTGAAPDCFVQTLANWHRHPGIVFSVGQNLLGDKGKKYSAQEVGPYLRPECTSSERRNFNVQMSRLRVRSEHVIRALKGRWAILKELRLGLSQEKDSAHATTWILECCVLHNICFGEPEMETLSADPAEPGEW